MINSGKVPFVCIADDDTGATDEAGMLTEHNIRTVILIDMPAHDDLVHYTKGFDAVVVATCSRAIDPEHARSVTADAVRGLKTLQPRMMHIKYCSTFDSTPQGNIGPSIEAALDELNVKSTVVVPALPVNGRTTYGGYHFVNGQLLSESSMKDHPLTPMTESNLVTLLQQQTRYPVGLAAYQDVVQGTKHLRDKLQSLEAQGCRMIVLDAVVQDDLRTIADTVGEKSLITGSSGLAMEIPQRFTDYGYWQQQELSFDHVDVRSGGQSALIVAGSCSVMTQKQNAYALENGVFPLKLDVEQLLEQGMLTEVEIQRMVDAASRILNRDMHVLLYSTVTQQELQELHKKATGNKLVPQQLGRMVSETLAEITQGILDNAAVNKLVVAGGETSGYLCRALELKALEVGKQIDPGVPFCFSMGKYKLALALKSGNFGAQDFYLKAINILQQYSTREVWQ